MADRILTWFIDQPLDGNQAQGPVHCLGTGYSLRDAVVRIHAQKAPDSGVMTVDIQDDGISIFGSRLPSLQKTRTQEEEWDDFDDSLSRMDRFSFISLIFNNSAGAKGITVSLELNEEEGGDTER